MPRVRAYLLAALLFAMIGGYSAAQSLAHKAAPRPIDFFHLPEGFAQQLVATGITGATGMAIAPDGRVFICEQTGTLRLVRDGKLQAEPVLKLVVDSYWERGLIGVTLDPAFEDNGHLYVVHVRPQPYPHHRVSRFTLHGDQADPASELVLLEGDDQTKLGGNVPAGHQGGGIRFGQDGKLYIALGEQTAGAPSQRRDSLLGKLLRINPDGSIPQDNPFLKENSGKYRAIWAYGLRNPFAFAVQPGTGRMLINDVGGSRWEEINEGQRGANYGWPLNEGPTTNAAHKPPLLAYGEASKQSISGGAFYDPPRPQFPAKYAGKYFFADFILNWIRVLDPDKPGEVQDFATNLAGPVAVEVAPDGSLYVLCRNAWVNDEKFQAATGALHRIFHLSSDAAAPRIVAQPADATTANGETVNLSLQAAGEEPLAYRWLKNGRTIDGAITPQLTLQATGGDDAARVQCVVSNARGTVVSRTSRLWITSLRDPQKPAHEPVPGARVDGTFNGWIKIDRNGTYTFQLTGAAFATLFVAGDEVVSLTPPPAPRRAEGAIGLKAGWHPMRLIAHGKSPSPELSWSGPGFDQQDVPANRVASDPLLPSSSRFPVTTLHIPQRPEDFPRLLSQTGVFTSLAELTPATGIVPYEVNSPLWSDGASKRRWIALRGDRTIQFQERGEWRFPAGTVFIKHFELNPASGTVAITKRLETRLLVTTREGEAFGVTYKWRPDGQEADLLDEGLSEEVATGRDEQQRWTYPGRKECMICHTPQAGYVLGANTRQLNRGNQLQAWSDRGMFERPIAHEGISQLPRLVSVEDSHASEVDRVRSYLDANCAQCHRPGGARGEFDARWETPLAQQKLLGGKLVAADLGIPRAAVVTPRDRDRSMLYLRMQRRQDVFNMPPLATHKVDADALELLGRWIDGL